MRVVYVDTGALIALAWARDGHHEVAANHYRLIADEGSLLITSNLVVAETATRLRYDSGLRTALTFRDLVERAVRAERLTIRYVDTSTEAAAWDIMEQYDGLTLSFPDCVGAVTARDARASAVFGFDSDFRVMGFALEP